jgi:hypothetical protein
MKRNIIFDWSYEDNSNFFITYLFTMKKILLFSFLLLSGLFTAQAQTINNIPIRDIDIEYILIIGTSLGGV